MNRLILALSLILLFVPAVSAGRVIEAGPDDYREYLTELGPGDTLRLRPGVYWHGMPLRGVVGEPGKPVVIEGPKEGPPAVLAGRHGSITVSLINVAHVTIRHLRLDGRGVRAHGIVAEGRGRYAHDVTLEHLEITGFDADQGFNGISTKAPSWNWVIRNNHIYRVGTGIYLGDSDGSDPFVAGLIEGNRIEDTLGYNMQIKHQRPRPRLDGMPQGPSVTEIRHNTFSKVTGGGREGRARPNLLLGHWPLEGPGSEDLYLVHGNVFFQNPMERLFQAEGRVALYNNLFVNWFGEAVAFMPHNDVPRVVHVTRNTIIAMGEALRITGLPEGVAANVEGNAVFSEMPLPQWDSMVNHVGALADSEQVFVAPLAGLDDLDLTPRDGRLGMPDDLRIDARWPDEDRDFHGRKREGGAFGAIER